MTVFSRRADVACARSNNSMLSISGLSVPTQSPLTEIPDFQQALGWLLNYTAANLPPASSLTFSFWNHDSNISERDWSIEAYKNLNSILAFTAWFFTENNFGNPQMANPEPSSSPQPEESVLPDKFRTTASTATTSIRFIIDERMFLVYVILQALPILFCWGVLMWRIIGKHQRIKRSSFPLLDFIFKAEEDTSKNVHEKEFQLQDAGDREFIRELRDIQIIAATKEL